MRARPVFLLVVAFGIAIGTALLAHTWLKAQRAREIANPVVRLPSRSVLVARIGIGRGEILRPDDLVWQPWPSGGIDKGYIVKGGQRTPQSFAGWVAVNPLPEGEPITLKQAIAPGDRGFLAAVLRPGMRAVSVPVTETSGVSGLVFPGDRVDLLLTYRVAPPNAGKQGGYEHLAAETVLRDLRVIAIGHALQAKPGEALVAHAATLEVTPKQAEAIALAGEFGRLSLSLHSLVAGPPGPVAVTGQRGTGAPIAADISYTIDSQISPLVPKAAGGGDAPRTLPVTILHGLQETRADFPLRSASGAQ